MGKLLREGFVISFREVVFVQGLVKVRRVAIEKGGWSIKFGQDLLIWQALELHSCESLMRSVDHRRDFIGIEVRTGHHRVLVVLANDSTGKRILLQVQEACGALHVGQTCWIGLLV